MSRLERDVYGLMRGLKKKNRIRLLDQNEFVCLRRDGVALYFDEDRYVTARRVLDTAIRVRKGLEKMLTISEIPVVLFADPDRLRASGQIVLQEAVLGYYRDGIVHLLSPASYPAGSTYDYAATLAHEMTHLALDYAMGGSCPMWLSEGLALYVEHMITGKAPEFAVDTAPATFGRLEASFPLVEREENYAAAYILTVSILSDFGPDGMTRFLKQLRSGRGPRDSFSRAVGSDLNRYYQEKLF